MTRHTHTIFTATLRTLAMTALLAAAVPAQAQNARKDYEQGKVLHAAGKHEEAVRALQSSFTTAPRTKAGLLLARSLVAIGRGGEAHDVYTDVIDLGSTSGRDRDAREAELAASERAELEAKLGKLKIELRGKHDEATITVGGRELGPAALTKPLWVEAGDAEVTLTLADGQRDVQRVQVTAGAVTEVVLGARAPEPEAQPSDAEQHGAALAAVDAASSQPNDEEPEQGDGDNPLVSRAQLGLIIGGKVGGGLGTGAVGATPVFELELGYALPPLDRAIEIFVSGQYTQPGTEGTEGEPDPRLPGDGTFSYELTQQELAISLGALYRIDLGMPLLMPYGGLGGRMYMLRTLIEGEAAGEPIGKNEETQTAFGLLVTGGVDIFLGPGALLAELQFTFASVDAYVLRDTNIGSLNLAVGYRVIL